MKKILVLMLVFALTLCGSAFATGTALPDDDVTEIVAEESSDLDLTALLGAPSESYSALLQEHGIEMPHQSELKIGYGSYTDVNGETVNAIAGIHAFVPGYSVYGFAVEGMFEGELSEEMTADGWIVEKRLYEGGLFYNYLEKPVGETVCKIYMSTDGGEITFLSVTIEDMQAYSEAVTIDAEQVGE